MKGKTILCISILYIVAIILMSVLITPFIGSFNDHEYILTVTDKDRVNTSKNSCYLVFCEDESGNTVVLKNSDTWLRGKFDSSNMQGEIRKNKKYKFTVNGYRVEFLSWYENIIEYEEIKQT